MKYFVTQLLVTLSACDAFWSNPTFQINRAASFTIKRGAPRLNNPLFAMELDEEYETILEEMIYSGDFTGFIRKKVDAVVNDDFLEYLKEKEKVAEDDDDKVVLNEIVNLISEKIRLSDGASNAELIFEQRLDKLLYTAPNRRSQYIKDNLADMTDGFITHIKRQMNVDRDVDNKVVFASILQLIGQAKGGDYLGEAAVLLSRADSSLGDQFTSTEGSGLIMDSTAVDGSNLPGGALPGDKNDQILAGLMFSKNDVLEDVLNNLDYLDDAFVTFLEKKIEASRDFDERTALISLRSTIVSVKDRVKEAQSEGSAEESPEELTLDQVKQRMREVQSGGGEESKIDSITGQPKFKDFAVKKDIKDTFASILNRFLSPPEGMSLEEVADANYDLCDYKFMELLSKEAAECRDQGANIEAQQYDDIAAAVNGVMVRRIGSAQERLQQILSKGRVEAMEGEVIRMCRKNEVDEALVLLIEANIKQAKDAGAIQAAEVLTKLRSRITTEKERQLPDEQRLLRALMREPQSDKRKELLYEAFKPAKSMGEEGGIVSGPPLISPPAFINVLRQLLANFGNLEGQLDIANKAKSIIDEAQVVATDLYGEGMSPREQQKFMFEKNTISVWDLANYEEQAMMVGEEVPWRNDKYDNKMPDEVLGERVKRVGGMDDDVPSL